MNRLTALGGFDAKGPACFLLETGTARIMLDFGRGPDGNARPRLAGIGRVDAVLISHGHGDHTGSLDWLGRIGTPPVYATAPVRDLAEHPALRAAKSLPHSGHVAGVELLTGPAGHAPGAVWIRLGGEGGLLYSGDYGAEGGLFACSDLPRAAVAVLDCSYGPSPETLPDQRAALLDQIGDGPCLLPVPAAGRGLEIALACLAAGREVAICAQLRAVAELMAGRPNWLVTGAAARLRALLARARRLDEDGALCGIMLAAGPNCGSGAAERLGPRALHEGVPVILTGHLSRGAPAVDWVASGRARRMSWNVHPDRATTGRMLDQTGARHLMAAFIHPGGRETLRRAFPQGGWTGRGVIEW
ncbi:MAG: MBL fold metallo-hydrolase [Paracoccus sp. (in: a-proteobacteria)]|nr:MBL fold metallo-hydrolase [Paracoccus sp. (in: a-proteobacteria)]